MSRAEARSGTAAALHARPLDPGPTRIEVLAVTAPALVLGSTQPDTDVDAVVARTCGVDVVRRRSGGGAVLLEPGRHLWVDVTIGRDDARWRDDVAEAFLWVGEAWREALAAAGVPGTCVHRGPLRSTRWSRMLCFAGVGPGEVLAADGRKLVGISQRRTRDAARFQCLALRAWEPAALVRLLDLEPRDRPDAEAALDAAVAVVDVAPERLVDSLVAAIG